MIKACENGESLIESYSFGRITIDGKTYRNDVIIFPDHVKDNWWRERGHSLLPDDISEVIGRGPETLIVGTGANDRMTVSSTTREHIESSGINLIVKDTEDACDLYNELVDTEGKVVAALHLTC